MSFIKKLFGSYEAKELKKIEPIKNAVLALEGKYKAMSNSELRAQTQLLRDRLAAGETLEDIMADAYAVCREGASRVLHMTHYPVQIVGGIVLHRGNIAEMKTGEGKTLVATLPVYLNALTGKGVHVVTVNDYLAQRDSLWMGKLYEFLGLTVGLILPGMDPDEKRKAYNCDITYGTNSEFGFDYLRDNMAIYKQNLVQRPFYFALVDEVDSILIDEARTPLIISGQGEKSAETYRQADRFAKGLTYHIIAEHDSKEELDTIEQDVIVDEKARQATLTKHGIAKAERYFNIENYSDPENMSLTHYINQALQANAIMKKDIDYVIKDRQIVIVDEFTGRLMEGRRYGNGLHQAIEAKEGTSVQNESKTLASITYQNYFRMYPKLAGMTGTAMTEADEFLEIYGLSVVEVPTNKPVARKDHNDVVYKTEKIKFNAVIDAAIAAHAKGQPVLIGTVSVEKSEVLYEMLKKRGVRNASLLNADRAKQDVESKIVAQAGRLGAITIATNMAGRGTDIKLGGNLDYDLKAMLTNNQVKHILRWGELDRKFKAPFDKLKGNYSEERLEMATSFISIEELDKTDEIKKQLYEIREKYDTAMELLKPVYDKEAELVKEAGGLLILGTERHESRRIDNQLRGRSGRQGDPGESRFYVSLEDDLMRLFGGERTTQVMEKLGYDETMPIENKMINNTIESAQKRIEGRNFDARKNVLKYDEVLNTQRDIIYKQRNDVLNDSDVSATIHNMVVQTISDTVATFCSEEDPAEWNLTSLKNTFMGWKLLNENDWNWTEEQIASLTAQQLTDGLITRAENLLKVKEDLAGAPVMRELERIVLLRAVDNKWTEHIDAMEELRRGMGLRSYGQHDPFTVYRTEGYAMFDEMIEDIRNETAKMVVLRPIPVNPENLKRQQTVVITNTSDASHRPQKKQPVKAEKIGRNDPCPCGSGKKYKQCHGRPGAGPLPQ
ncbi:MAG: preprotein translocase subunit SecA [Oscillospiraceae bacterium]|nr:preprotein translocase subunit SecA [Oscillospiraceae bacterium]